MCKIVCFIPYHFHSKLEDDAYVLIHRLEQGNSILKIALRYSTKIVSVFVYNPPSFCYIHHFAISNKPCSETGFHCPSVE